MSPLDHVANVFTRERCRPRLDLDAVDVVFRDEWVSYSRGKDRWVNYEGSPTWAGVDDMVIEEDGCLVLKPIGVRLCGSFFEKLM